MRPARPPVFYPQRLGSHGIGRGTARRWKVASPPASYPGWVLNQGLNPISESRPGRGKSRIPHERTSNALPETEAELSHGPGWGRSPLTPLLSQRPPALYVCRSTRLLLDTPISFFSFRRARHSRTARLWQARHQEESPSFTLRLGGNAVAVLVSPHLRHRFSTLCMPGAGWGRSPRRAELS